MQDFEELELQIMQMITDTQLPQEILNQINFIYLQYKQAYSSCICDLSLIEGKPDIEKAVKLRDKITHEYNQYMHKVDQTIEEAIDNKSMKRVRRINEITLNGEQGKVDRNIFSQEDNQELIKNIQIGLEKHLLSSRDKIISIMDNRLISSERIQKVLEEKQTQSNFKKTIGEILEKIRNDFPMLTESLDVQDEQIYQKIIQLIQPNKSAEQRKQFVEKVRKGVIANIEEANRKIDKQDNEKKEIHDTDLSL